MAEKLNTGRNFNLWQLSSPCSLPYWMKS